MTDPCTIREYRPSDRQAVRAICIAAGIRGRSASEFLNHTDIWADLWTGYYLLREPSNCVVACQGNDFVGYLVSTADSESCERYVTTRLLPAAAGRAIFCGHWLWPRDRIFFIRTLRAMRRRELSIPPWVIRDYPGHFHFNLLAECRGLGLGGQLYRLYEQRMRDLGLPGLHAQVLASNDIVVQFHLRRGYRPAHRTVSTALSGVLEPGKVELVTLVKEL